MCSQDECSDIQIIIVFECSLCWQVLVCSGSSLMLSDKLQGQEVITGPNPKSSVTLLLSGIIKTYMHTTFYYMICQGSVTVQSKLTNQCGPVFKIVKLYQLRRLYNFTIRDIYGLLEERP